MGWLVALLFAAAAVWMLRRYRDERARERARASMRVNQDSRPPEAANEPTVEVVPLFRTNPWLPWLGGLVVAVLLGVFTDLSAVIVVPFGALTVVLLWILQTYLRARRFAMVEQQLADVIDLIVSSLHVGGGLAETLRTGARETAEPLRGELADLVERVRLGQDPAHALHELTERIPTESYQLFAFTLTSHWGSGGNLTRPLSVVGRSIRDRIGLSARIRTQAREAQVSVIGVLVITYLLGAAFWVGNPDRVSAFLATELGALAVGSAVLLQTTGLLWMTRLASLKP